MVKLPTVTVRNGGWLWIDPGAAGLRSDLDRLQFVHSLVWRQLHPDNPHDRWSREVLGFKNGEAEAVESVTALLSHRLPRLLDDLGLPRGRQIDLVTALSAADARENPGHPLYRLASALEDKIGGCRFRRGLLRKAPHERLQFLQDFRSRDAAVAGKYRIDPGVHVGRRAGSNPVFLILDDFATRGATLADIARAITSAWPAATVHALALAKNVYQDILLSMGYAEDDNERRLGKKS